MSDEETRALIAEARQLIAHCRTYNFGLWSADKLAHEVAGKLADALEATLTEPDEWCREEACEHRHWRSGPMPTHRRGESCPSPKAGEWEVIFDEDNEDKEQDNE